MKWLAITFLLSYHVTLAWTEEISGSDYSTYEDEDEILPFNMRYTDLLPLYKLYMKYFHPLAHLNSGMVCGTNGKSYPNITALTVDSKNDPNLHPLYSGPCDVEQKERPLLTYYKLPPNTPVCGNDLKNYRYLQLLLAQSEEPSLGLLHIGPCDHELQPVSLDLQRQGRYAGRINVDRHMARIGKGVDHKRVWGRNGMGTGGKEGESDGLGSSGYAYGSNWNYGWSDNECGYNGRPCENYNPQCGGPGQPPCQNYRPGQCGQPGQPPCQFVHPGQCGGPGQPPCPNQPGFPPQTTCYPGQPCYNPRPPQQCYPGQPCYNPGNQGAQCGYGQPCYGLGQGGGGLGSALGKAKLRELKEKRGGRSGGRPLFELGYNGVKLIGRSGMEESEKDLEDRGQRRKRSAGRWVPLDKTFEVNTDSESLSNVLNVENLRRNIVKRREIVGRGGRSGYVLPLAPSRYGVYKYQGRSGWKSYVPAAVPLRYAPLDKYPGRSVWHKVPALPPLSYVPVPKYPVRSGHKYSGVNTWGRAIIERPGRLQGKYNLGRSVWGTNSKTKNLGRNGWSRAPILSGYPPRGWSDTPDDLQTGRYPGSGVVARSGGTGGVNNDETLPLNLPKDLSKAVDDLPSGTLD